MKVSTLFASVCLIEASLALSIYNIPFVSNRLGLTDEPRLIKLGPSEYKTIRESDKLQLKRDGVNFMDVTDFQLMRTEDEKEVPIYDYPTEPKYEKEVNQLIKGINTVNLHDNLANFTSFYTRYYKSQYGYESALWLKSKIEEIIAPLSERVTVSSVVHNGWDQFSIVVSIPGSNSTALEKGNIVVVGSHQDSINLLAPSFLRAPGADDNGSGTVTCLEALRILIEADFKPLNTVEFHFYSAEEGGLLGSLDVFTRYAAAGEKVVAMLQQDMTGFIQKTLDSGEPEHVGLITDYTTPNLNEFLKLVIDTYCLIPYRESSCGYACSDHGSALQNGYPASFIIESSFKLTDNYIHSIWDTLDRLSFEHMAEHAKLTLGYAYELGMAKF